MNNNMSPHSTYPLTRATSFGNNWSSRNRCISETVESIDCMSTMYLVCKWLTAALVFSSESGLEARFFCLFNKVTFLWYSSFISSPACPQRCYNKSLTQLSNRNMVLALPYRNNKKATITSTTKRILITNRWKHIHYIQWHSSWFHSQTDLKIHGMDHIVFIRMTKNQKC